MSVGPNRWPWVLSALVAAGSIYIFINPPDASKAADVGDFLSGVAGTLAFIWLIAGFQQQRRELAGQAQELQVQRRALEGQLVQLGRMAKHAALGQIAAVLDGLKSSMSARGVSIDDVASHYVKAMAVHWKDILADKSPETVYDNYMAWLKAEGIAHQYLATVQQAGLLYGELSEEPGLEAIKDPADFVKVNYERLVSVPHLAPYMVPAKLLADAMLTTEPGRTKVHRIGKVAVNALMPGVLEPPESSSDAK